jgi:hypothetical protein
LRYRAINGDCKQRVKLVIAQMLETRIAPMNVRIITLECLLRRLEELLGTDNLLYRRFEQGLLQEDERCLTDAMSSLRLYPDDIRRLVEDTVMSWLFGARSDSIAAHREAAPRM